MPTNKLLEELRKTKWGILRHHPDYYMYFGPNEPSEGKWYEIDYLEKSTNLWPTDRFEFREDGEWGRVYELRKELRADANK